jgi:rhodanese-related sulfurtransferase
MDPAELVQAATAGALLLDVREPEEWDAGHLADSVHVPMSEVPGWLAGSGADVASSVVVICRSGHRSAHVTAWLQQQGVNAVNLDGGLLAWAVERRPLVTDTGQAPFIA